MVLIGPIGDSIQQANRPLPRTLPCQMLPAFWFLELRALVQRFVPLCGLQKRLVFVQIVVRCYSPLAER